ncbi:DUF308 domain-containing protein [Cohnella sp. REN36]|uniref:YqeB family protein n=1 Tax=Cohnella sp. REN36 TaxID=2887347 RepID=UPI001D15AF7E|nr:DUF308 domain-containing protein [Cohnella sp. REN36]MCC3374241.1 DUF308 domain-containing protein [Cohnella sp. REN36]
MSNLQQSNKKATIVQLTRFERALVLVTPPVLGLILGYFVPAIADWAASLPWFPFQGPLKLIASIQAGWTVIVTAFLGLIAGVWLTNEAIKDSLVITISDDEATLSIKSTKISFSKPDIASVFMDGKQLVLIGRNGLELARESFDSTPAPIADAFIGHGYPWSPEGDPFEADYRLWVKNTPDLPPALNALMKAREQALLGKDAESAKEIQREAGKLGVSIRDKGKFQYWRNADRIDKGDRK